MILYLEKWEELDKYCYVTKGIKDVINKITSDNHFYLSVTGVPGSGKSTAIRHAAIHLKINFGFSVYPILYTK